MIKKIILTAACIFLSFAMISCLSTKPKEEPLANVLQLIKERKLEEAKSCFISKYDINAVDEEGNTALHLAAKINEPSLALFLLCNNADPDPKNYENMTPLHVAIENEAKETVAQLVNFGCNIFARNGEGITALDLGLLRDPEYYDIFITTKTGEIRDTEKQKSIVHYFVETKNNTAIEYCAKKGIPLSIKDIDEKTPLKYAYDNFNDEETVTIAATLIMNGAEHTESEYDYFETAILNRNLNYRYDDGQTPLHLAAIQGHTAVVKYLLNNKAQTNVQDSTGATPLHEAVRYGHAQIVKLLLDFGADINAKDNLGKTPVLLIIPSDERAEIYSLLVNRKANLSVKDMYGDTVLHIATMTEVPVPTLRILIDHGADVNARNKDGVTPLALAIENDIPEHISFYAQSGADINSRDTKGTTPLILALKDNDSSDTILKSIVNPYNISSIDSEGNTPLIIAIQNNATLSRIQYIISLTDDVNKRNADGNTALYLTVLKNRKAVGELLLAKKADIFATNNRSKSPLSLALYDGGSVMEWVITPQTIIATDGSGNTALHFAAEWGLKEAVATLIIRGSRIEAKNANGETPLFCAAKTDSPEIIQLLVNNGCKVNARDNLGSTALHMAVRWGNPKAVAKLISIGAEIDAQNVAGNSPLAESVLVAKTDIANLLMLKGANPNRCNSYGKTILMEAIRTKNINMIKMLLSNNANPQIQDLNGRNAYHEAALSCDTSIISMIRNAGGNPLSRDKNGITPFSLVLDQDAVIIREVLGSDTTISDSDGNTPIHIIVKNNKAVSMLKPLINAGYPFDTRNAAGYTPLTIAVQKDNSSLTQILLESGANPFISIDSKGTNPVSIALTRNNKDIIASLVKNAGSSADTQGNTILHYAAKSAKPETISKLISYGLDTNVKNIYDETPYATALRWKRTDAAQLLNTSAKVQ